MVWTFILTEFKEELSNGTNLAQNRRRSWPETCQKVRALFVSLSLTHHIQPHLTGVAFQDNQKLHWTSLSFLSHPIPRSSLLTILYFYQNTLGYYFTSEYCRGQMCLAGTKSDLKRMKGAKGMQISTGVWGRWDLFWLNW